MKLYMNFIFVYLLDLSKFIRFSIAIYISSFIKEDDANHTNRKNMF